LTTKKVGLVVRVSDVKGRDKAADKFVSPELQIAGAAGYAAGRGFEVAVIEPYDLNVSHTTPLDERPAMSRALMLVESGKLAGIVVSSQDRLGPLDITRELKERLLAAKAVLLVPDNPAIEVLAAKGYAKLPGELLRQLTRCKAIGRFGLGVDNIDLPAAKECGIAVNYVPDYCLREVSDHAMALLLALARKVTYANKLVQSGRWEVPPIVPLRRLEGQVLGLVGFGNIPRALAPKAKSFGLKVLTHDPYVPKEALASTLPVSGSSTTHVTFVSPIGNVVVTVSVPLLLKSSQALAPS